MDSSESHVKLPKSRYVPKYYLSINVGTTDLGFRDLLYRPIRRSVWSVVANLIIFVEIRFQTKAMVNSIPV